MAKNVFCEITVTFDLQIVMSSSLSLNGHLIWRNSLKLSWDIVFTPMRPKWTEEQTEKIKNINEVSLKRLSWTEYLKELVCQLDYSKDTLLMFTDQFIMTLFSYERNWEETWWQQ